MTSFSILIRNTSGDEIFFLFSFTEWSTNEWREYKTLKENMRKAFGKKDNQRNKQK